MTFPGGFKSSNRIITLIIHTVIVLCGLTITKNAGAVFKVILDTLRTITVWIISVIIRFEDLKPPGKVILELSGFIFLIMGNLIYNELVVLKFCGLHKYIKKNREKNENKQNDDTYQSIEDQDTLDKSQESNDLIKSDKD